MVVAVSMVKDEGDIIEQSIHHMLTQVDHVIVADNGSTDGTQDILKGLHKDHALRLEVFDDPEIGYYQARKMTALAEKARQMGAEWVIPFDADEIWLSPHGRIADVLQEQTAHIASVPILNYVATAQDPPVPSPTERLQWRLPEALPLPKVACRALPTLKIHAGNHGASYDVHPKVVDGLLEVRHFPYRSPEQFIRKVRNGAEAYAITNLPYSTGQHWREYGENLFTHGPEALRAWFREHFYEEDPESKLIHDPLCRGTTRGALTVAERSPGLAPAST